MSGILFFIFARCHPLNTSVTSGVPAGADAECPPWQRKKIANNQKKEGIRWKKFGKKGENREKDEKSGRRGKNREGSYFAPPNKKGWLRHCLSKLKDARYTDPINNIRMFVRRTLEDGEDQVYYGIAEKSEQVSRKCYTFIA